MLKYFLIAFLFFLSIVEANIIELDDKTKFYDLLPNSKIYIDKSKSLTIENIVKMENEFKVNDKKLLGYGYSPDFDVWIKFTLKNTADKPVDKILKYGNALTTHIEFFSPSDAYMKKEGLYQIAKDRKTIYPIFKINLQAQESKTFYIKASSHITTLIVKLSLYDNDSFYEEEIKYQLILGLFFASMFILGVYNLFIYFFTKDLSYLYYVLYVFGVIVHHMAYVGFANVYLLDQASRVNLVEYASLVTAFPIYFLALFTKSFLHTNQYPVINKILNIFLIVIPISIVLFLTFEMFYKYRNLLNMLLFTYLIIISIYAAIKKNRQANFILFGWFIVLSAGIFMYISSIGVFDIYQHQPYLVEIAFVVEAVVFSIALADRIKQLQKEKIDANTRLISQQKNEKERLELQVAEKTIDLKNSADEKEMLLKELNHRVKNNMQTIVSLVRLQLDETDDTYAKTILTTTYNRINAMNHLHELLYYQNNISNVNANDYFTLLVDEIQDSYSKDIKIHLDISSELKLEQAIYCGLILNELITNAFKHAFPSKCGNIYIKLSKSSTEYLLSVADDGIGYNKKISSNSLGLILVDSLIKSKLRGTLDISSEDGVKVLIKWKKENE